MEVYIDWKGIVHHNLILESVTVNKKRCKEVSIYLCDTTCMKQLVMWAIKDWVLLYDNVLAGILVTAHVETC